MSHDPRDVPFNIHFLGARKTGKTYCMVRECGRRARVCLIDPSSSVRWRYTTSDPATLKATMQGHRVCDLVIQCAPRKDAVSTAALAGLDAATSTRGWCTLAIDELHFVRPAAVEEIQGIARVGRHGGLDTAFLFASQRAVDATPDLRAIMDLLVIFRVAGGTEHRAMRDIGGRALEDAVQALPRYHAIVYDTCSGRWHQRTPEQLERGDWGHAELSA